MELSPERLAELSTQGPRYTSYPPATELRELSVEAVRRELARVAIDRQPISLYVHVPFCRSLCAYCGCNVIPTRDRSRGSAYVDTLATELALLVESLGRDMPVSEVALGGGSPNFLEPSAIRQLNNAIETYFQVQPDARRSVELDPRTTSSLQIVTFGQLGFRSLSVGVQDFAERVQDAIRRHQSLEQTRALIETARDNGFTDINVDIVYGLPHQTEETFAATIDAILELAPDRVALFGYAHLPSKLPHQLLVERSGRVLDRFERATLLLLAIDRFARAGYLHLGLDHFARPDSALAHAAEDRRMARTFQGYVERRAETILGVGTSAISSTSRAIWQNELQLSAWEQAIASKQPPVARGFLLTRDDQIRRALIERLMCDGEADLDALGNDLGIELTAYFAAELEQLTELQELAFYDRDAHAIRTTPLGRLLVRNVCMVFDRYARPGQARFSSTI
ncbi:MAG: oxygen-independent coproporphyrinogen III oxidase [Kofleriaceae bacterium]